MTPEEVDVPVQVTEEVPTETSTEPAPIDLNTIEITDSNVALNVMVGFLNVAQRRGVFAMSESAKIWECLQKFILLPN